MRHNLRVLLAFSTIVLGVSLFTMVGYALSIGPSSPSNRQGAVSVHGTAEPATTTPAGITTGGGPAWITDTQVCGMVTSGEVFRLLNYVAATGPGMPQPVVGGGGCAWGTGYGEAFEVTVVPRTIGPRTNPCAGLQGTEVRSAGWIGCSRLDFGSHNVLRAFKGRYVVSIEPLVNVIGFPYLMAEQATITHVFHELGA
ncbi:MAG: hypothetical protein ACRDYB_06895 [Acidimicrobiales bacterium]